MPTPRLKLAAGGTGGIEGAAVAALPTPPLVPVGIADSTPAVAAHSKTTPSTGGAPSVREARTNATARPPPPPTVAVVESASPGASADKEVTGDVEVEVIVIDVDETVDSPGVVLPASPIVTPPEPSRSGEHDRGDDKPGPCSVNTDTAPVGRDSLCSSSSSTSHVSDTSAVMTLPPILPQHAVDALSRGCRKFFVPTGIMGRAGGMKKKGHSEASEAMERAATALAAGRKALEASAKAMAKAPQTSPRRMGAVAAPQCQLQVPYGWHSAHPQSAAYGQAGAVSYPPQQQHAATVDSWQRYQQERRVLLAQPHPHHMEHSGFRQRVAPLAYQHQQHPSPHQQHIPPPHQQHIPPPHQQHMPPSPGRRQHYHPHLLHPSPHGQIMARPPWTSLPHRSAPVHNATTVQRAATASEASAVVGREAAATFAAVVRGTAMMQGTPQRAAAAPQASISIGREAASTVAAAAVTVGAMEARKAAGAMGTEALKVVEAPKVVEVMEGQKVAAQMAAGYVRGVPLPPPPPADVAASLTTETPGKGVGSTHSLPPSSSLLPVERANQHASAARPETKKTEDVEQGSEKKKGEEMSGGKSVGPPQAKTAEEVAANAESEVEAEAETKKTNDTEKGLKKRKVSERVEHSSQEEVKKTENKEEKVKKKRKNEKASGSEASVVSESMASAAAEKKAAPAEDGKIVVFGVARTVKEKPVETFNGPAPDVGPGWTLKKLRRMGGSTKGTEDRYWFSPVQKKKFRSKAEIRRFKEALDAIRQSGNWEDDGTAEDFAWKVFKGKVTLSCEGIGNGGGATMVSTTPMAMVAPAPAPAAPLPETVLEAVLPPNSTMGEKARRVAVVVTVSL